MPSWGFVFMDSATRLLQRLHLEGVLPGLLNRGALRGAMHPPRPFGFEQVVFVGNLSNIKVAGKMLIKM